MKDSFWRVCDANMNRAREGLRVCEEIARFVLKDESLTRQCQRLRYDVTSLSKSFPRFKFLKHRDVRTDVGRPGGKSVSSHAGYQAVAQANARRVEEALRVLEEFMRMRRALSALAFSQLRFRAYALEQALLSKLPPLQHH